MITPSLNIRSVIMNFYSINVVFCLFVAIVERAVLISSNPISPFPRVESGTQDFDEVASNAKCPFTFKVIEIWLTENSKISIGHITCKRPSTRSSNHDGDRRCIQLTSPLILDWNVSKTNNTSQNRADDEGMKWSRNINSGCVYSEVNDRSQHGNLMPH